MKSRRAYTVTDNVRCGFMFSVVIWVWDRLPTPSLLLHHALAGTLPSWSTKILGEFGPVEDRSFATTDLNSTQRNSLSFPRFFYFHTSDFSTDDLCVPKGGKKKKNQKGQNVEVSFKFTLLVDLVYHDIPGRKEAVQSKDRKRKR